MDAFIKLDKMNKKRNNLSTSNISINSFGSILQSIRETDNAEDDQTDSIYSTPKNKAPKIQPKPFGDQNRINSSSIMSSGLNTTTINFTTGISNNKSNLLQSIHKSVEQQKPEIFQRKPAQVKPKSSANMVLKKLGKGFETENSSKNTSASEIDVIKTSYVDKSRAPKEPPRKWGTDMKKSFATNLSSDDDSDLDLSVEEENQEEQNYFVNASNPIYFEKPYFVIEQNKAKRKTQYDHNGQNFLNETNTWLFQEKPIGKSMEKSQNYRNNEIKNLFQMDTKRLSPPRVMRQKIQIRKPPRIENYIDTSSQSEDISSLARKFRDQRAGDTSIRSDYSYLSKNSDRGRQIMSKNTYTMTGKKGETVREYTIAILEYCSHEIGLACYNNTTGQFHLCQLVENLTYFRTLSTVQIFAPLEIIYSITFENTLLIKRLKQYFRQTSFKGVYRRFFDQLSGYNLYLKTANRQYLSSTSRFLAFSCFNALLLHLQTNVDKIFKHESLSVQWHKLDQLLVIQPDAVCDLQIFYNYETKKNKKCLVENFHCITFGGTRMLRANLLQPPSEQKIILQRQKLLEKLLQNPSLLEFVGKQFHVYKFYEPVTAKFIQLPKQQSFKSLKAYLSSIFLLSKQCLSLERLYTVLQERNAFELPIFEKLDSKLQHHKVKILKSLIEDTFEENMLKNFEEMKNKKDKYIFLFKVQKIEDPFAAVTRQVYIQTVETIKQYFETVKRKTSEEMQLMFNDHRGYFIKVQDTVDLHRISQRIEQNLVQISGKGKIVTFSTQIMSSLNNRLKQSEHVLVFQSESLLRKVIGEIQRNIDILFEINQILSTIDMVMSFATYVNRYSMFAKFHKPTFVKGINKLNIVNLKPVWLLTPENHDKNNLELINLSIEGDEERVVLLEKTSNSISQSSFMFSTAYAIILSQMGCFVPAQKVELRLFDSILSKIQIDEKTQHRMSRFQMNLVKIQNIFDNCFIKNEGRSLVLMDEIVRGSQHEEQCALSLTTIKELERNKGISILTTSDRMLVQFMLFSEDFKHAKIIRTQHSKEQIKAIEEITVESIAIMENSNFDRKFIEFFDEIKIQPTYLKLNQKNQNKLLSIETD